jgi:hypothetical protein
MTTENTNRHKKHEIARVRNAKWYRLTERVAPAIISKYLLFVSMISFMKTNCHYFRGCVNGEGAKIRLGEGFRDS